MPSPVRRDVPPRPVAASLALTAIVLTLAGCWVHTNDSLIAVEFPQISESPGDLSSAVAVDAWWGFPLAVCYGLGMLLGTAAAGWVWRTSPARGIVRFAVTATVVAVTVHLVENVLLLTIVDSAGVPSWLWHVVTAAAALKYAAMLPAGIVAVAGAAVLVWRCVAHSPDELARRNDQVLDTVPPRPVTPDDPPAPVHAPVTNQAAPVGQVNAEASANRPAAPAHEPVDTGRASRWRNAYVVPDVRPEAVTERWNRGEHTTGFCLSGGGIRAASVAMGALQSLRAELLDARYLVSVSGGGYTAGALQQALTGAGFPPAVGTVLRDPRTAFGEGTAEFSHVRRHSSYLADTPGELLSALGRVARGLLLSLAVLFGPAVALGVAVAWLYERVPVTALPAEATVYPAPRVGALVALGLVVATAFGLALFARGESARRGSAARLSRDFTALSWVVAAVVLVFPVLAWTAAWLLAHTGRAVDVGGPVGAVLLTYLATIASMAWRHRVALGNRVSGLLRRRRTGGGLTAALPDGLAQRLLVIVTTGVLAVVWLLLFGAAATTQGQPSALWTAAIALAVVVLLGGVFDNTSLSLHPFYRERLARAFAVRVVRRHGDGQVVAVPYEPSERTTLSAYGMVAEGARFPEIVFAAAANLKGGHRTPPGLNAVSYTMSAKWTGGPDVGWVRTDDLERIATGRLRRDLTVQGAVALSGAAFASAMGRSSRWFQVLLAVSGARLGTWLPNPGFLRQAKEAARRGDWAYPWLPRARRLPYLLREVFGSHPHHDRLLHISDGGHYDNLGLVELLRRRCTLIYCVDASNDTPPSARTLAEALELAWQELGVRVELDHPWLADPGSGQPHAPGNPLAPRLAQTPIITGTVHYPPESGLAQGLTGRLVVARAVLWSDLPYTLQSYAAHHPEFPYDSTGDQWFGHAEFAAYTELGRHVGTAARAAVDPRVRSRQ